MAQRRDQDMETPNKLADHRSAIAVATTNTDGARKPSVARRRAFMKGVGMAGAAFSASALLPGEGKAFTPRSVPNRGDVAILRLLAAAELIEADLWQQYAELGGVSTGEQNPYQLALQNLDSDG